FREFRPVFFEPVDRRFELSDLRLEVRHHAMISLRLLTGPGLMRRGSGDEYFGEEWFRLLEHSEGQRFGRRLLNLPQGAKVLQNGRLGSAADPRNDRIGRRLCSFRMQVLNRGSHPFKGRNFNRHLTTPAHWYGL